MSKIPEGATHKAVGPRIDSWYRNIHEQGFEFMNQGMKNWQPRYGKPRWPLEVIEPQTPTWNGPEDGLPPVGLEVEVLWSSCTGAYVTGKILAHDEDRAVFRFTSGERKGEYQADKPHFSTLKHMLPNFRPIRTAEQLAAEERERGILQLAADAGYWWKESKSLSELPPVMAAIYDAGYRKTQP